MMVASLVSYIPYSDWSVAWRRPVVGRRKGNRGVNGISVVFEASIPLGEGVSWVDATEPTTGMTAGK